jgi:hypothetical protein
MDRQQKIDHISALIEFKGETDKISDDITRLFGNGDNVVTDRTWILFDIHLDFVSKMIGDENYLLSWYIFDNDAGKEKKSLKSKNNKDVLIDTVEKLVDFISLED